MALLINDNGETKQIEPKDKKGFQLQELYDHIGCNMVQVCEADEKGHILIFDEEFLCKNAPILNRAATKRMAPYLGPFTHNMICGKAVMCLSSQFE